MLKVSQRDGRGSSNEALSQSQLTFALYSSRLSLSKLLVVASRVQSIQPCGCPRARKEVLENYFQFCGKPYLVGYIRESLNSSCKAGHMNSGLIK